jgi:hypothetical protein
MLSECFWIHWQHLSLLGREKQLIELSPILGAGFFAQLKASYAEKISSTMLYTHQGGILLLVSRSNMPEVGIPLCIE